MENLLKVLTEQLVDEAEGGKTYRDMVTLVDTLEIDPVLKESVNAILLKLAADEDSHYACLNIIYDLFNK